MPTRRVAVSDSELEVLKILWEQGPATARQVEAVLRRQGRRWVYTTVLTFLLRLQVKGYVASDKSQIPHVFRAAVSRQKLLRRRLKDLADELCQGTATPLIHALVEAHRFTPEEIEQFRGLLDQMQEGQKESKGDAAKEPRRQGSNRG